MDFDELLLAETTNREFKEHLELRKARNWLKTIVAFANTDGGWLLFGVNDRAEVVGLPEVQIATAKISEKINAVVHPAPRYQISCVRKDNKDVICVEVGNGPHYPYYYVSDGNRIPYVRLGAQSVETPVEKLNELLLKGTNRTFDSMPSVYHLSDISFTLLSASLKRVDNVGVEHPKDLQSLGLLSMDNLVTNAGLLLCDQTILKQAKIVCTRWRGTQKGMLDDALDDKEFTGSLIIQLEQAEAFATMHTMRPWRIEGFRRIETPDYPDRSVREVLVNALVHRDYQVLGSEIHVDMFDDRMEIVSPGGMKDGSKIQDRDLSAVPSLRRNELLADVFTRLNYMDRRGSGFSRILLGYPNDRIRPMFRSDNAFFSVSLPNLNQSKDSFIAEQDGFATKQDGFATKQDGFATKQDGSSRSDQTVDLSDETMSESKLLIIAGEALKSRHLKGKTLHHVVKLYQAYGCTISFRRKDAVAITQLSPARMSKILEILVDEHLIYRETSNAFRFVTDWHSNKS